MGKLLRFSKGIIENRINLEKDREKAFQNSMKNFKINKQKYDKTKRRCEFKVGDAVFVRGEKKLDRNKLDKIFENSFKILRMISNSIYEVDDGNRKFGGNSFHSSKLVPHGDDN